MTQPTILAFGASNSHSSINATLAGLAAQDLKARHMPDARIETMDLNAFEMPIYSPEREQADGIPPQAQAFWDQIAAADAVIVSFAEYNGSYTAAFKNLFDWTSRISMKIYQDKPVLMTSASMGPRGGMFVLQVATQSAPFFGADLRGSLSVGPWNEVFDAETGAIADPEVQAKLTEAVDGLAAALVPVASAA